MNERNRDRGTLNVKAVKYRDKDRERKTRKKKESKKESLYGESLSCRRSTLIRVRYGDDERGGWRCCWRSEGWERWDIINTDKHSESSAFGNERQRRSDKRGRDQRGTRRLQREALVEVTQGPDGREYSCTVSGVVEHCRFLVAALIHG